MQPMRLARGTKEGVERRTAKASTELTPKNNELLTIFTAACYSEGLSYSRVHKYICCIVTLQKHLTAIGITKPIHSLTEEDLRQYVAWLEKYDTFSKSTKQDYKRVLKKIFKWLNKGRPSPLLEWMRVGKTPSRIKHNGELLTEDEVSRMIAAEGSLQAKAFTGVLYESGMRHSEILTLNIKNVRFDQYGCLIDCTGKTGPRSCRIVTYSPLLKSWIDGHPQKNNPEAPLWINWAGKNMGYAGFNKHIKAAAKLAGIEKRVFMHLFRHSRATHVSGRMNESFMRKYFGWSAGSSMPSNYIHLGGSELDRKVLELNGIAPEAAKETPKLPTACPRCAAQNMFDAKTCRVCEYPLSIPEAIAAEQQSQETDKALFKILSNEKTRAAFKELLRQVVVQGDAEDPHSGPLAAGGKPKETIKEGL